MFTWHLHYKIAIHTSLFVCLFIETSAKLRKTSDVMWSDERHFFVDIECFLESVKVAITEYESMLLFFRS